MLITLLMTMALFSCSDYPSPREEAARILALAGGGDFDALQETAPFLYELNREEQNAVKNTLAPYGENQYVMEVQRQGIGRETLFITPYDEKSPILIMTMEKNRGQWILKEKISFQQKISFIPLEN
ncbi:MAG: hypothetical protein PQJ60_10565 [Spirochaetales bacterium]|nr:hypothetical protein [Spirochaetales bacterium]